MARVEISFDRDTLAERTLREVGRELDAARRRHAAMASPHEGHSVIREEFEELWEHVRADTGCSAAARAEAIQLAAMAIRYVVDLCAPRVTHGRHCPCGACRQEDWTKITAPCGMHGDGCPAVYAPLEEAEPLRCKHGYRIAHDTLARQCYEGESVDLLCEARPA